MTKPLTPTAFLQAARVGFSATSSLQADALIEVLKSGGSIGVFLALPAYIPSKYHDRMESAWRTAVARMVFEKTTLKLSYAERYRLAQNIK